MSDIVRTISEEYVCGFKVAAYRETHPKYGDKYGHTYSEHWSTPSQNPKVTVERLFTETQLRFALSLYPDNEYVIKLGKQAVDLLTELVAVVRGECPHLLDGERGGYEKLAIDIEDFELKLKDLTNGN